MNSTQTFNPNIYLTSFRDKFGQDVYDHIEQEEQLINKRCQLKKDTLIGIVECLWLPKVPEKSRPNHLWLIKWGNGNYGICELKDIEFIES